MSKGNSLPPPKKDINSIIGQIMAVSFLADPHIPFSGKLPIVCTMKTTELMKKIDNMMKRYCAPDENMIKDSARDMALFSHREKLAELIEHINLELDIFERDNPIPKEFEIKE